VQRGFYACVLNDTRENWWDEEGCALILPGYGEGDALNEQQRALAAIVGAWGAGSLARFGRARAPIVASGG
jgi:hypothetical protein